MPNIHSKLKERQLNNAVVIVPGKVNQLKVSRNFNRFVSPARILVSGPTNCGKSFFILNLVKERDVQFDTKFTRVSLITRVI